MAIDGDNFVRFTRRYFKSIRSHWHRMADGFEVFRSVKHLKFWDQRQHYGPGMLLDHTYEKIKAIPVGDVYEVRLADKIGGQENI